MLIKEYRLLWLKFEIRSRRFISIPFPIPLYIFWELLDCFLDLLTAACFFVPKVPDLNSVPRITIHSVKELIIIVMKLLNSLTEDEEYDFVDVTTDNVKVIIKIR